MPSPYKEVLVTLGRQGDFKDNVLKVNILRNDVTVTVAGVATPTPFGFGGWMALTKANGGMDVMMGDLVLLQDEVNPVMSACSRTVSKSRRFTIISSGTSRACSTCTCMDTGRRRISRAELKPALDLIGKTPTGRAAPRPRQPQPRRRSTRRSSRRSSGTPGEQSGAVYKITIGRDDLKLTEMGAPINARMG